MKIFVASPLGFAESTKPFIRQIEAQLQQLGYQTVDPWNASQDLEMELEKIFHLENPKEQRQAYHDVSMRIAQRNSELLRSSNGVLAVLDGADIDSGTASEIGYAFGLGDKVINGLRTDFRRSGENDGVLVNLQVQYWIEASGGKIITSLSDLHT